MNVTTPGSRARLPLFITLTVLALLLFLALATNHRSAASTHQSPAGVDGTPEYLPFISKQPLPTATPVPPVPQVLTQIPLPNLQCPKAIDTNPISGYTYIAALPSNNVAVLDGLNVLVTLNTGEWPTSVASDNDSARVYVANLHGDITGIEYGAIVQNYDSWFEPFAVTVNPVNGYAYVADLDSLVRILDENGIVDDLTIPGAGWLMSLAVHPTSGLTYVASWETGMMYVIDGTELVDSFRVGWGPRNIAIDPVSNYVYVAHEVPNEEYPHNISVFVSGTTPVTTTFSTAGSSEDVAVDPLSGFAYVANRDNHTVTILRHGQLIGTAPVGLEPWAVTVDPATGYAFVANRGSNSVTIFKDGLLVTTLPVGQQPSEISVDEVHGYIYVVNESFQIECNEHNTCWTVCNEASVTILD